MSKEGVTVGVRVRPLLAEDGNEEQCVRLEGGRVAVAGGHRLRQFPFHHLFDRSAPQQQVFELFTLPLLEDLFRGYNCCFVAYGQNRSGKSFTVCGGDTEETKGIIPRIVDHLSCKLYTEEAGGRRTILRVSYVDIWQEEVIDLLSIRRGVAVEVAQGREQTALANVEMKTVGKVEDIETHFILGNRKRHLAYTKKYRNSEQSASVFSLYLETIEEGRVRRGKLDIVEMQASDVVARFQPAITPSKDKQYDLSANSFRNVVNSLIYGSSDSVIPYNDSKITQILRNALGGNAKAKFLFHLCPTVKCHDATIGTLRTASACQLIENTPAYNFTDHSLVQQVVEQEAETAAQLKAIEQTIKIHELEGRQEEQEALQPEGDGENEFLSRSVLQRKRREERAVEQQRRIETRDYLKKQLQNLLSLFLTIAPLKNKHQITFFKDNYTSALDRLAKNTQNTPPPASLYESAENWSLSETSFRKLNQKERFYKQELYDLQREFQQERQLLLSSLREVTQQCRFFQQVAERAVRPEELELLRANSKYDPTSRTCRVPAFAIRDKRITHASRYFSPQQAALINSRAISERKFMMTQLGEKPNESRAIEVRQSTQREIQENPYFHRAPKRPKAKQKSPFRMSQNEYELVRSSVVSRRLKEKPLQVDPHSPRSSSRSEKVKPIKPIYSPRFRFK